MDREELGLWLRLVLTPGIGNNLTRRLLAAFGSPSAIFDQPASVLEQLVGPKLADALAEPADDWATQKQQTWQWLQSDSDALQRSVVTLGDAHYPASLLNTEDPPALLYLMGAGHWPQQARCLAIVGSRNPTPQGVTNARQFGCALAQQDWVVVSGMALGIDGAAHEGALQATAGADVVTVAIVGTGLDRVYPARHQDLARRIAARGLLVSEYPLGTPPLPANFPKRNRLIAGLSEGALVVEAALQSGSLITARLATEMGREVFAIPGSIHSTQSRGCHALIKQGAKLVESAEDVLEELGHFNLATAASEAQEPPADEVGLIRAMGFDPVSLDALQARTGLSTSVLQARLLELELQGLVGRLQGGLFQRQVNG